MKFSIIMPTFNRQKFIVEAINGILKQDYQDWELIIQNGGDSIAHLIPFDMRVKLFEEKDNGITDAMNKGMRKATGDVFNWQNDDDCMTPQTLSFVAENMNKEWLYGRIAMIDKASGNIQSYMGGVCDLKMLLETNYVPQPSVYWTRKAYETLGDMDESIDLTSDYDYWIRLMKNFEPQFFDRIMAYYFLHPEQLTNTQSALQLNQSQITRDKHK